MELIWILGVLFVFVTMVFLAIAYFLPEWVGITGKIAKQAMNDHIAEESKPASSEDSKSSKNQ